MYKVTYETEGVEVVQRTFETGLEALEAKADWEDINPNYIANIFAIPNDAFVRFH
jgi:hypothetical protein